MTRVYVLAVVALSVLVGVMTLLTTGGVEAAEYKVLVVMSYEEDFPWDLELKEGIDSVLAESCELKYFYMNTKKNLAGGEEKAKEAYALYQEFQPDGVITTDDNAQAMFVVPYLKDMVDTPVMFCGVNADPDAYGYPASNVSGSLERYHINESIALAQQILPSIQTVGFMGKENPTQYAALKQIEHEKEVYTADVTDFKMPNTVQELKSMAEELKANSDAVLLFTLTGTLDENGKELTDKEAIPIVADIFGKPLISIATWSVRYGCLATVVHTGQEQGTIAGEMVLKAMQGTPISELPITQNKYGHRLINVAAMKALGITPKPSVLRGVELVTTEE